MENFVFRTVVLKLISLEGLYLSINEEVIDCADTRYRLLHDCSSAIFSLQNLLRTYCKDWHLKWSRTQQMRVDKALLFNPFAIRRFREARWYSSVKDSVSVVSDDLPF